MLRLLLLAVALAGAAAKQLATDPISLLSLLLLAVPLAGCSYSAGNKPTDLSAG
jgi:hypothetical protein